MKPRLQGASLFGALLVLVGTLIMVQLWLVGAALEALLAGANGVLLPAALASLGVFLLNGLLLLYALAFDRRIQRRHD